MKNIKSIVIFAFLVLIVIGAFCLLNQNAGVESNVYQDDYVTFEYPEGVDLLFDKPSGGRSSSQSIEFLSYSEKFGRYESTGLRLSYLVSIGESEGESGVFDSMEALEMHYGQYDLEMNEYSVDGRSGLQIITLDMTGETFFTVIPAESDGDAYRFNGVFMGEDVQEILSLFASTAELHY